MNVGEVVKLERDGKVHLLYTHDKAATRHCVDIDGDKVTYRINEVLCFCRGTHARMLKLHGYR